MTEKGIRKTKIANGSTLHQVTIASMLISILPILSLIYLNMTPALQLGSPPLHDKALLEASVLLMVSAGVVLLRKHTNRITILRQNVMDATQSAFSRNEFNDLICDNLHDVDYIESCLNASLTELQQRTAMLEQGRRAAEKLEQTIRDQHGTIYSMQDMCRGIQQPASTLKQRLNLLTTMEATMEQRVQVAECRKEIHAILGRLGDLQEADPSATPCNHHKP